MVKIKATKLRGAFTNISTLVRVYVPASANINANASNFSGCTNLTHVFLGEGTVGLSSQTFANCSSLRVLNLENTSVTRTGTGAYAGFRNCTRLRRLKLPVTVTVHRPAAGHPHFRHGDLPLPLLQQGRGGREDGL